MLLTGEARSHAAFACSLTANDATSGASTMACRRIRSRAPGISISSFRLLLISHVPIAREIRVLGTEEVATRVRSILMSEVISPRWLAESAAGQLAACQARPGSAPTLALPAASERNGESRIGSLQEPQHCAARRLTDPTASWRATPANLHWSSRG